MVITLKTPGGNPAFSAKSARASADSGVSSDGFKTTVHPTAKAGAILRVIIAIGKFQGVIAATTPIGCFKTIIRLSNSFEAMVSPYILFASSANQSTNEAP